MSKVHVRQYRPAFFEGFEDWEGDVDTVQELCAIPFITRWATDPIFDHFEISHPYRDYPSYHNLMAMLKNGEHWVVAQLHGDHDHPIFSAFPPWHP
jgi:hypothetical protein